MKKSGIFFLLLILFTGCQQDEAQQALSKIIICGKISNFDEVADHDFIGIKYHDLISDFIELNQPIDNNGEFRFEFHHDVPIELLLEYGKRLSFYVYPGDSLYFDIDGTCRLKKLESYKEAYSYYQVSGTNSQMNKDVSSYTAFYFDSLRTLSSGYSNKIATYSPSEYKIYVDSVEQELKKRIAFFNERNETCDEFKTWVKREIKYEKWFHLLRYPWLHPLKSNKDYSSFVLNLPDDYFDFLDWGDGDYQENLGSKYYLGTLDEFYNIKNLIKGESIENREIFKDEMRTADTIKNIFLKSYNGLERDFLITKLYCRYLNNKGYHKIKDIFKPSLIEDDYLRRTLVKKFESEKDIYENPEIQLGSNLNDLNTENGFVQQLIKKYPNKVIYLDFWAPWCGPCMNEMTHAEKLKKQLNGEDFVFVYLANQCKESAWKATIAEKNIIGEHYLLSEKQFALLRDIFSINSIPHFAIIDKDGEIINYNAPRPSSGEKLIELLENI